MGTDFDFFLLGCLSKLAIRKTGIIATRKFVIQIVVIYYSSDLDSPGLQVLVISHKLSRICPD